MIEMILRTHCFSSFEQKLQQLNDIPSNMLKTNIYCNAIEEIFQILLPTVSRCSKSASLGMNNEIHFLIT